MGNFWRSFSEGVTMGDRINDKLDKYRVGKELRAINSEAPTREYSNEGLTEINNSDPNSGKEWVSTNSEDNPLGIGGGSGYWKDSAGNQFAPQDTPSVDEKGNYTLANGKTVGLSQYRLGDQVQDKEFSKHQLQAYRLEKAAQVMDSMGEPEKAQQYRAQGLQTQMLGEQLQTMRDQTDEKNQFKEGFKNAQKITLGWDQAKQQAQDLYAAGDAEGAGKVLINFYNKQVPDGTNAYMDDSGHLHYSQGDKLTSAQANIYNPDTFKKMVQAGDSQVQAHIKSLIPVQSFEQMMTMRTADNQDRGYNEGVRQFGITSGQRDAELTDNRNYRQGTLDNAAAELKMKQPYYASEAGKNNAEAGWYARRSGGGEHASVWQPVGQDKDGTVVSFDRTTNRLARTDGKPVQDQSLFRKVTGEKATREMTPDDLVKIRSIASETPGWDQMPAGKQSEVITGIMQQFNFAVPQDKSGDPLSVAPPDKSPRKSNSPTSQINLRDLMGQDLGFTQADLDSVRRRNGTPTMSSNKAPTKAEIEEARKHAQNKPALGLNTSSTFSPFAL